MRPDDPNTGRVGTPLEPQRSLQPNPNDTDRDQPTAAVADIARRQLEQIYQGNTDTPTPQTTPVPHEQAAPPTAEPDSPYDRTHEPAAGHTVPKNQWEHYHSAWQDYYQKYYERYYLGQVYHTQKALMARAGQASVADTAAPAPETLSRDEALYDLRSKLKNQIKTSAQRVRKSRHFIPIAAALCVMALFLFLQYNRVLFANIEAYISPGNVDPANIIIDPTTVANVGPEPKLIIPKINVDVPVIYDTQPDYNSQMKAMESGVAYFGIPGANSKPGQVGNTVLSGHSSNDVIDSGNYKFIFARLEKLTKGDTVIVNYQSKRYVYTVTKQEVVKPSEVNRLVFPTTKPLLTLITCVPIGTSQNRLLVTTEQVSPDPNAASAAPAVAPNTQTSIPGSSPTIFERIFGGGER